ncbi:MULTISPECIES: ABC transporter ATP-binding protein/permease [Pelosinus]|uniref:ABC transporter domain-containing protein n=1 Tax=Pelosinus fermentans B4 TaxID=1149862 RepID=I9LI72_9FIRM|nr:MULTISPECIES: SbmA/BacA-like family transporter [Pelosinus]EIW20214.1 ABC transporter domain-containing protein [Pelosinus fermentans B4]EIW25948.1 ABC transporter domain-containing protein [Pelosinus fermentans A11]OAM93246.1 ABC transporter domain-containing protein [Pelosinus fermentans DSM 17108]SDQ71559.1 putative ATP-binding cassette transporter [Pelosinus fermentans]
MRRGKAALLLTSWKIARSYWFSEEKWSAWGLLVTVITLNLGIVYMLVLINTWQVNFYEVIQSHNYQGFMESIGHYCVLAACLVVVRGYQIYTRMMLHIGWRRWMTERYLSDWLAHKTYYLLQLSQEHDMDNPDQRISEDIEMFVWLTLRLSLDLLQDLVTILSFIVILWNLSGIITLSVAGYEIPIQGYLVWVAMLYAMGGTYWTVKTGRPLVKLDFDQQRYEADFRFSLMRLRENAESIALYGGERQEKWSFHQGFGKIVATYQKIMKVRRSLTWLTSSYTQVSSIFASIAAAPRYFTSQIHLGQMFQIVDAYRHVQTGFSFVVDSFTLLAQWRAVVNRLNNFLVSMEMVRGQLPRAYKLNISREKSSVYSACNLQIFLPDGSLLLKDLSLSIKPADKLLIMGESGCGKSTLLRTFAGIWPYASGKIIVPDKQKVMFVPQKSYLPCSSLRETLVYPDIVKEDKDKVMREILVMCKLAHLTDKLHIVADWGHTLSLGEQQRVAFARVLLQKPNWLFLDEATSALDESTEQAMYKMIVSTMSNAAIISVGHRSTLMNYHTAKMELNSMGNCVVTKIRK